VTCSVDLTCVTVKVEESTNVRHGMIDTSCPFSIFGNNLQDSDPLAIQLVAIESLFFKLEPTETYINIEKALQLK
jgi:hypothetical protein